MRRLGLLTHLLVVFALVASGTAQARAVAGTATLASQPCAHDGATRALDATAVGKTDRAHKHEACPGACCVATRLPNRSVVLGVVARVHAVSYADPVRSWAGRALPILRYPSPAPDRRP